MGENPLNEGVNEIGNGAVKNIADALKNASVNSVEGTIGESESGENNASGSIGSEFKVARTNLPEKTGFWTKVKAFLFQEIDLNAPIKVELTPYQQKVEDEINGFLHQEVTWQSFKNFLFKEVPITYKGKRIF